MATIRLLTPADVAAFAALRAEALVDSPWAFAGVPGDSRDAEVIRTSVNPPHSEVVGGFDGETSEAGAIIASAGILKHQSPKRAHVALIWAVYVTPRARGTGIGRATVAKAIEIARSMNGVTTIQLSCSENSTAARTLYESLGFKVWGIEPDALRVGDMVYREVHMSMPNP